MAVAKLAHFIYWSLAFSQNTVLSWRAVAQAFLIQCLVGCNDPWSGNSKLDAPAKKTVLKRFRRWSLSTGWMTCPVAVPSKPFLDASFEQLTMLTSSYQGVFVFPTIVACSYIAMITIVLVKFQSQSYTVPGNAPDLCFQHHRIVNKVTSGCALFFVGEGKPLECLALEIQPRCGRWRRFHYIGSGVNQLALVDSDVGGYKAIWSESLQGMMPL